MSLTGSGVQVGSASQFGIAFGGPVALASDGTTVFMFHLRRGYTLDPVTGVAVQVAANNLGLSSNPRLSAAMFHNGEIIVHGTQNDQLYSFDTTTYTLTAIGTGITIAGSGSSPVITGMTSLGGVIYVAEAFTDALMILDESNSVLTPVDANVVGYGLDSPNIQSLAAYKGALVAVNIDSTAADIRLVELSQTDGAATDFNNVVPPDNAIVGMVEHDGKLLAAGNANDALFRMYDVLWDATIADLEVDEGNNATWSLSGVSQDADTFSLPTSPPSWLSVSGTDLVATTAPDVTADQNNDVTVRASRDGIDVDEIIRVIVRSTGPPPPVNISPVFGEASYTFSDVALAVGTVVGTIIATDADSDTLVYSLVGADASGFDIDSDGEITVVTALTYGETYNFSGRVNDGTVDVDVSVTATAIANSAPVFAESTYTFNDIAIAVGSIVGTVVATDENNDTLTYSLTGTDAADFDIDVNGQITVVTELTNSETYNLNVVANDGTDDTSVAVSVRAAEPPAPSTNILEQTALPTDQYDNALVPVAYEDPNEPGSPLASRLTRGELQDLVGVPEQVNADWDASAGASEILNKPALAPSNAEQNVKSDWDASSGDAEIENKPTVPTSFAPTNAEQNVKSDWDANSGDSEILNKPDLASVPAFQEWDSPEITNLNANEVLDMFVGNVFNFPNAVKFDAQFRIRKTDGSDWGLVNPRLSLPVATGNPARMIGSGQGYGGSSEKSIEPFDTIEVGDIDLDIVSESIWYSTNITIPSTDVAEWLLINFGKPERERQLVVGSAEWHVLKTSELRALIAETQGDPVDTSNALALRDSVGFKEDILVGKDINNRLLFSTPKLPVADHIDFPGVRTLNSANTTPTGITFDPVNNEVLVSDSGSNVWYRYQPGGTYLGTRTLNSANVLASGITFDSVNNEVLVSDSSSDAWYRYQSDGTYLGTHALNGGNSAPRGITYDSVNNEVLVVDSSDDLWYRYESDGTYLGTRVLDGLNSSPAGMGFDSVNNEVLVLDGIDQAWYRYETDGTYLGVRELNSVNQNAIGITYNPANNKVLVLDNADDAWYRYEIDGIYLGVQRLHNDNGNALSMAYDTTQNHVFVLDTSDDAWWAYRTDGDSLGPRTLNSLNADPRGIVHDPANNEVLVSDSSTGAWYRYEVDGAYLGVRTLNSANVAPRGMTFDSGNNEVLVLDQSGRWFRYELDGTYLGIHTLHSENTDSSRDIEYNSTHKEVLVLNRSSGLWYRYQPDGTYLGTRELNSGNSDPGGMAYDPIDNEVLVVDRTDDAWYRYTYVVSMPVRLSRIIKDVSVNFRGSMYTTSIANIGLSGNLIEVQIEKLQYNDSSVFIQISGSYMK